MTPLLFRSATRRNLARQMLAYLVHLDGCVVLGIFERVGGQYSARGTAAGGGGKEKEWRGGGAGTAHDAMKESKTLVELKL